MTKNKILTILLSAAIAFSLWLYVITVVSPASEQTFYNIPVYFRGESILQERGYMVITEDQPKVHMTLSGNRTDLNKINSGNITLTVDLSTIDKTGTQSMIYEYSFPGDVANNAITVLEHPGKITLEIERRISKEVPVNVEYRGSLPENFVADKDNLELDYDKVLIAGPEPVIKQITQAVIEVDLSNRTSSFMESIRFALCDSRGEPVDSAFVETNVGQVNLLLKIQRLKEIALKFDVIAGGGATEQNTLIEYDPKSIMIAGPDAVIQSMEDTLILGTIDLGALNNDTELTFKINLPGVTNLTGITDVTVSVKFPALQTKTLTVTNIAKINVPDGKIGEIDKKSLTVVVRGLPDQINRITANDLSVTVDFSEAKLGNDQISADVIVNSAFDGVGVLGTYKVSTTMRNR